MNPGSDISPAQARQFMDDLSALIARACAEIGATSPKTVVRRLKPDQSPVTAADEASEAVILQGLARILPKVPVVAEELASAAASADLTGSFVIVDPLDGTREFLAGRDEFTVNLAIVTRGLPVAGIIAAPKQGQLWRGVIGHGAERLRLSGSGAGHAEAISTRSWPDAPVAAVSRSHMDAATDKFVSALGPITRVPCGSAIKFCHIAEGSADIYPRLGHDLRVGCSGRPCIGCRRWRTCDNPAWHPFNLRACRREFSYCRPSSPGQIPAKPPRSKSDPDRHSPRARETSGHLRSAVAMIRPGSARKVRRVFSL